MAMSAVTLPTIPPTIAPTFFLELPPWSPPLEGFVVVGEGLVAEVLLEGVVSGSLPTSSANVELNWFSF